MRPTIGHNRGPRLEPAPSWQLFCWRRARRAAWAAPPVEIVRIRSRRAAELGLSYRDYTSILLDRGRVRALIFDLDSLLIRGGDGAIADARGRIRPRPGVLDRLAGLKACRGFILAETTAADLDLAVAQLNALVGAVVVDQRVGGAAHREAWKGPAIRDLLARHRLSPAEAVMVGGEGDRAAAEAAGLARFIPGGDYFRQELLEPTRTGQRSDP